MEATRKTLEHASSISHFDIIELWHDDGFNSFECKFAYATEAVQTAFNSVIVGDYPHHSREHIVSQQVNHSHSIILILIFFNYKFLFMVFEEYFYYLK